MRVAFATDDGKSLMGRHFGDASFYEVFAVSESGYEATCRVNNTVEEEKGHADPNKAKGIAGLLKKQEVQVVVAKVFGPNIKRIKKHFVCILVKYESINDCLDLMLRQYDEILVEFNKGADRGFLDWRNG